MDLKHFHWLAYGGIRYGIDHYRHFAIPKRGGGQRLLSSPRLELRQAQLWILRSILAKVPIHQAATAYRTGFSAVDNARLHAGKGLVVRMDILDFFPSITLRRVRETFAALSYDDRVSLALALLTTTGPGSSAQWYLPQGACTSPALSNIVSREMDAALTRVADNQGFVYTRYADDMVFSHPHRDARLGALLTGARHVTAAQGFRVNDAKTSVMRSPRRQTVTGLVVNVEPRVSRQDLRRFRAFLHRCECRGLDAVTAELQKDAKSYATGYLAYVQMVDPEQADRLRRKHSWLVTEP